MYHQPQHQSLVESDEPLYKGTLFTVMPVLKVWGEWKRWEITGSKNEDFRACVCVCWVQRCRGRERAILRASFSPLISVANELLTIDLCHGASVLMLVQDVCWTIMSAHKQCFKRRLLKCILFVFESRYKNRQYRCRSIELYCYYLMAHNSFRWSGDLKMSVLDGIV